MPEFRFRKKRVPPRRHTLHDSSDLAQQLQQASQLFVEHTEVIFGPNEVSVDEAVQRRLNPNGPAATDQVIKSTTSSSEPSVKANVVRKISSKYSECLYLRHGSEMRRCPMPSPITLTTIRQLFVNLFDLSPAIVNNPTWHLFILDRSNTWKPLDQVSGIYDHCTLLLVDSSDVGTLVPSPISIGTDPTRSSTGTPENDLLTTPECLELSNLRPSSLSPESIPRPKSFDISLLSSVAGEHAPPPHRRSSHLSPCSVSSKVDVTDSLHRHSFAFAPKSSFSLRMLGLFNQVQHLKHDLLQMRAAHQNNMSDIGLQFSVAREKLQAVVRGTATVPQDCQPSFRHERMALERVKEDYISASRSATHDFILLQSIVEGLRIDAVERRCKIDCDEIDALLADVKEKQSNFYDLRSQYSPLEQKLRDVMKQELHVIVNEEQFIKEEPGRLEDVVDVCDQLYETLYTLKQLSSLQNQRSPHIPVFPTASEVNKDALLLSISGITPNHTERLRNLELAELVQQKRNQELTQTRIALKAFEKSLKDQHKCLKQTGQIEAVEKQRELKLKDYYMDEKIQREQELEKELQIKEELKAKRRQKEREEVKNKFKMEEEWLKKEEKRKEELRIMKEEKQKLEKERKKAEEERKKLEELKRQQEEEEKRKAEETKRQRDEEKAKVKNLEAKLRQEMEKEREQERKKMERERLRQVEEILKLEIEKEKLEQQRKFEEEQRLLDDLLNSDSPQIKAQTREAMWRQIQERAQRELEEEQIRKEKTKQLRSQQMVMDNLTTMAGSTPLILKKESASSGMPTHFSNPYLPQRSNDPSSSFNSRQLWSLNPSQQLSYPTAPLLRRLTPSLSTDLKRADNSYDTLEKVFRSEESISALKQNHYDLPWSSKQLPPLSVPQKGSSENSPIHRRNKSEGLTEIKQHGSQPLRENQTPSPAFHHSYVHSSQSPPPKKRSTSKNPRRIRSPVYDEVMDKLSSQASNGHVPGPPSRDKPTSKSKSLNPRVENGVLPTYSQVMKSSSPRQRSYTTESRITQYPVNKSLPKPKPSVSYV